MANFEEIEKDIEILRGKLNYLIKEKDDLLDPEIIAASEELDRVLEKYDKIINHKNKSL